MPKEIREKTATPPPRLISSSCERPPIERSNDGPDSRLDMDTTQKKTDSELPAQTHVSNITQGSPVRRVSAWFDNMQLPPRSRSPSPETETTPRPLRVLKARKSFLQFDSRALARAATPTPRDRRRKPTVQPSKSLAIATNSNTFGDSAPPKRSFLGLRLSSPTTKVISPQHIAPSSHIQTTGWGIHPPDIHLPRESDLKATLHSKPSLSRQMTGSSGSTAGPSSSFMALPSMSQLINWKQRSSSDGTKVKTRSLSIDRGPSRVVQMVHPTITYESVRHVVSESPIFGPPNRTTPARRSRRATSAGPGNLPSESSYPSLNSIRPLTPRPTTQTNIEYSKSVQDKPGVLSRVLCSIPDMSPLSGNRPRAIPVVRDNSQVCGGRIQGDINYREVKRRNSTEHIGHQSNNKGKGGSRGRGALGSIRKRFGSSSIKKNLPEEHISMSQGSTAPQPCKKKAWAPPPILRAQLNVHSESTREHVEGGREIWVCIEVEGRVNNLRRSTEDTLCEGSHKGMDIAIILDLR